MASWAASGRPGHRELLCEDCGTTAAVGANGWRGELADDPDSDEPARIALYCPECGARRFPSD